jgi:hypothetical protein
MKAGGIPAGQFAQIHIDRSLLFISTTAPQRTAQRVRQHVAQESAPP